ncbi:MAG: radical SAM protein [Dictyoglomus sp. NZ13-RE01]|nr:MAG: radical SAM protein [Dictyoglomus sp. NZ13-RE01]
MNWYFIKQIKELKEQEKGYKLSKKGGDVSILLIFPNRYSLSLGNLGYLSVYKYFNDQKGILCERAYIPDEFPKNTSFPLYSIETQRPAIDFDIWAFSLSFEMDYFNVIRILNLEKVPIFSKDRDENYPLIMAGGIAISSNPEPLAEVFDLIFIGEAEDFIKEFSEYLILKKEKNWDKITFLEKVSSLEGVYIPRFSTPFYGNDGKILKYESLQRLPIKKRVSKNFSSLVSFSCITSPKSVFPNMVLLEGVRGCIHQCRFCLAGYFYRPFRRKDILTNMFEITKYFSDNVRIGLILPSIDKSIPWNDLKSFIEDNEILLSLSSLRLDQIDDNILEIITHSKQKTLTIAPETGSDRLRSVINKNFSNEDIINFVGKLKDFHIKNLKLYFMIGLPTETSKDLEEIYKLVDEISSILSKTHVSISISPFVPKPHTPFQWEKMQDVDYYITAYKYLSDKFSGKRNIKIEHEDVYSSLVQGLISRGDRRISIIWNYLYNSKKIYKNFKELIEFYLFRERDKDEFFPWNVIDIGVKKEYLWREREKAYQGKITHKCFEGCKACGVC